MSTGTKSQTFASQTPPHSKLMQEVEDRMRIEFLNRNAATKADPNQDAAKGR